LSRAGLRPLQRGSHLLRFSLPTSLLHGGASMAEIGQVLGHRSRDTTEIYAKVNTSTRHDPARGVIPTPHERS
jgi:site-specific recombinase XerD